MTLAAAWLHSDHLQRHVGQCDAQESRGGDRDDPVHGSLLCGSSRLWMTSPGPHDLASGVKSRRVPRVCM
jgi:hypothetical protein